ncbi:MAG: bifunctional UDP-N-acetylmuramoyl-tripeptide:D-alanyl-D-alanine ligase/alanine racemase [Lewinellaceae bacterium]|nr:bifunctional UDP-N-acetylmuramoyl-tripeptide:D-alanyl-D-alanine ligase/alanine racemase [Lewinellaceae bacterium]
MTYTLDNILHIIGATWQQQADPMAPIERLLLDSRHVSAPAYSLFFAIRGERHDGHRHAEEAYRAGVRHFVLSRQIDLTHMPDANVLLVEDTLDALQSLAAAHRAHFHIPVVGITGSNGKTVVKEWLYQLLAPDFDVVRSPKSYNSQTGVPLSVWQMREENTLALFEAGISQPGEMERLERIIRPTIGIFTNIGPAHREGFSSKTEKVREKMLLFGHAQVLICCADHESVFQAAQEWRTAKAERRLFCWSAGGNAADMQISTQVAQAEGRTALQVSFANVPTGKTHEQYEVQIPFTDAAAIENTAHCLALLHWFGISPEQIQARLPRLEPVEMRLELKAGIQQSTLINDFYNNDLASLRIALQFAAQQARSGKLTLILSDILQSGLKRRQLYEKVAALVAEHKVGRLIGIGADIPSIGAALPPDTDAYFYPDTDAFMAALPQHDFSGAVILLKGARPFAFERIARRLEQKAHKTALEVNLTALIHNLKAYHRLLQPGTRMLAMVKAAGYGSGSAEVAKLLEFHKVDYLGVAYADEGIELRQTGVNLPVLVLNPEPSGFDAMYRYRLEPEIYSLRLLGELIRFSGGGKRLAIHLKLDTGMHRLGFDESDLPELLALLRAHPELEVRSVFSHLSASDAAGHDDFTHRQAAAFHAAYEQIGATLGYAPLRHIVNSGGIARFPQYHYDMVRLGIGLYGVDAGEMQGQLRVVNVLKATISQIRQVRAGETVGYNRNGPVGADARIATISIGYADGFLRLAGNGRYSVSVRGRQAPTIGNICMDMSMIDVTHIPEAAEGDEVTIFGEDPPVQVLAACLQTIPYEVFTNISERVKRVYWQE